MNTTYSSLISDDRLILITSDGVLRHAHESGERIYLATYEDGSVVRFAVPSAEHARKYAREYGIRFHGGRVIDCRWDR